MWPIFDRRPSSTISLIPDLVVSRVDKIRKLRCYRCHLRLMWYPDYNTWTKPDNNNQGQALSWHTAAFLTDILNFGKLTLVDADGMKLWSAQHGPRGNVTASPWDLILNYREVKVSTSTSNASMRIYLLEFQWSYGKNASHFGQMSSDFTRW